MKLTRSFSVLSLAVLALVQIGCGSGGPEPVRPGTPAFFWRAALENFTAGDYVKTIDQLGRVTASENEFTARGRAMRLAVLAGLVHGLRESADQFENGARANKTNPTPFRRKVSDYRGSAMRTATEFAETYAAFQKAQPQGDITLDFPYPSRGTLSAPAAMTRIAQGESLPESDMQTAHTQMLQRGVLHVVCDIVGASNDTARAQEAMKARPVAAKRDVFELAMAESLYEASTLFSPQKGADPTRQEFLLARSVDALKLAGDSGKAAKELKSKIEKDQKDVSKRKS
jgi:hypothetical protein